MLKMIISYFLKNVLKIFCNIIKKKKIFQKFKPIKQIHYQIHNLYSNKVKFNTLSNQPLNNLLKKILTFLVFKTSQKYEIKMIMNK